VEQAINQLAEDPVPSSVRLPSTLVGGDLQIILVGDIMIYFSFNSEPNTVTVSAIREVDW